MKRFLQRFRGLQWKLTLVYTLVTVAAILLLELGLILAQMFLTVPPPQIPGYMVQRLLFETTPTVAPYLESTSGDEQGLAAWLDEVAKGGVLRLGSPDDAVRLSEINTLLMAVVDAEGRVVAAKPSGAAVAGSILETHLPPREAQILRTALNGPPDPSQMWADEPDGSSVAAAPIFTGDWQKAGAMFLRFTLKPWGRMDLLGLMLDVFLPSLAGLALFTIPIGTLFGYVTARWLTRRLRTLAAVTEAWGEGDFSAFVHASARDEVGQLGRQLNRMAEQLQNLLQTREELASLEERNRLARDLHDSVKQQVFAVTMTLGAVGELWEREPVTARQKVREALALSRQAQTELAGLIHELRPVELEGKGLAAALRDYAETWSQQTGIAARVVVHGDGTMRREAERACFRVVQEALSNVARHSGASRVEIRLESSEQGITLTVADDGSGFDPASVEGRGLGLRSMRERVEALGGHLSIEAAPGEGTRVMLHCGQRAPDSAGGEREEG
jgi:NarL family two-component system sensor histidine kinase LiaS